MMFIDRCSRIVAVISTLLFSVVFSTIAANADIKMGTGVFPDARAIEGNLMRGKSTREDVKRLLGIPSGTGRAMLPGTGDNNEFVEPYDVWYYEDIASKVHSEENVMVMDIRLQILLIFFKEKKFHGYFWTSNEVTGEAN